MATKKVKTNKEETPKKGRPTTVEGTSSVLSFRNGGKLQKKKK